MSDIFIFSIHNPTTEEQVHMLEDDVEEMKETLGKYIKKNIDNDSLLYFGRNFGCEPEGTKPINPIKILWEIYRLTLKSSNLLPAN